MNWLDDLIITVLLAIVLVLLIVFPWNVRRAIDHDCHLDAHGTGHCDHWSHYKHEEQS